MNVLLYQQFIIYRIKYIRKCHGTKTQRRIIIIIYIVYNNIQYVSNVPIIIIYTYYRNIILLYTRRCYTVFRSHPSHFAVIYYY